MSRIRGRGPGPRRDYSQSHPPGAKGPRRSVTDARRQLRKAVTEPVAAAHGQAPPRGRRWPPALAFALVMLGLSALVGLIGGFALLTRQPIAAVAFLVFGVAASASGWSLARGRRRGYWASVVVLALVGAVPTGFAFGSGAGAAALVLAPPLVVAGILLKPSVRAELVTDVLRQAAGDTRD